MRTKFIIFIGLLYNMLKCGIAKRLSPKKLFKGIKMYYRHLRLLVLHLLHLINPKGVSAQKIKIVRRYADTHISTVYEFGYCILTNYNRAYQFKLKVIHFNWILILALNLRTFQRETVRLISVAARNIECQCSSGLKQKYVF